MKQLIKSYKKKNKILVYSSFRFEELLHDGQRCLDEINEKIPQAYIIKFDEKMKPYLKSYNEDKLIINIKEGTIKEKDEEQKIKYIKSKHDAFKNTDKIDEFLLYKFITQFMVDRIKNSLNTKEIIKKYLSQIIINYIIDTFSIYNQIMESYMNEIAKNKEIIAQDILDIDNLENNKATLEKKKNELWNKLNQKKNELDNIINRQKMQEISLNEKIINDKNKISELNQDKKELQIKLKEKSKEIKNLKNYISELNVKIEDNDSYNANYIYEQYINEQLIDNNINITKQLNDKNNELNVKLGKIINENNIIFTKKD